MAVMKTPGVYIVEKNAFPNSVVEVATAVPAFVGYTEHASDKGKPLTKIPTRISSLAEFERYFGGPPAAQFEIKAAVAPDAGHFVVKASDGKVTAYNLDLKTTQFRLYYAMKHFYQNYGGVCWIVSVGAYGSTGMDKIKPDPIKEGIKTLTLEQEPTMLVIPDAMELSQGDCNGVQQDMLTHCGDVMKTRFAILDIWGAKPGSNPGNDENVKYFRGNLGVNNLMFGAAYYPWVHTRLVTENDFSYRDFVGVGLKVVLTDTLPAFKDVLEKDAAVTRDALKAEAKSKGGADDDEKVDLCWNWRRCG